MMQLYRFVVTILLCCLYTTVYADIYTWVDENGVKHFTNYSPPAHAEVIMKTEELPHDEQADQQRMAAERQERLVAAWQELADKEAELLDRQRAAEQQIEAANTRAEEALREAEALLNEAEERHNRYSNSGFVYYGYYPYYGHHKRWYYRKNGSLYYKYPYYKHRQGNKYRHKQRSHVNHRLSIKRQRSRSHVNGHRFNGLSARFGRIR